MNQPHTPTSKPVNWVRSSDKAATADPSGDPNHWVNMVTGLEFADERLVDLLRYWQRKRGDRLMPQRSDIEPLELGSHLSRLHFIEVEYDPFRLRYRLIGTATTDILGRDMTGRYFDEIYPPHILADAMTAYIWVCENKMPLRLYGNAIYADKSMYNFEDVNLPLSNDGVRVNMILGELVFRLVSQD